MTHPMTPELAIEELAEEIGALQERGEARTSDVLQGSKVADPASVVQAMLTRGLLRRDGETLRLTPSGEAMFRAVIRRHRLAEVLLGQVLRVSESSAGEAACQFEHMLSQDVTDSICTFLGHPPACPHSKPIPRGDCCASFRREVTPLIRPVVDLSPGSEGTITFIDQAVPGRIDRLATLGIVPGTRVRLVQRHPAVVLRAGSTTVAIDRGIAAALYVRPN